MTKTSFNLDSELWEKAKKVFDRLKEVEERINNIPTNPTQWIDRHLRLLVQGKDPVMQKYVKYAAVGAAAAGIMGASVWGYNQHELNKLRCRDFRYQEEAQVAYDKGAKQLDGNDKDKRACEHLPTR